METLLTGLMIKLLDMPGAMVGLVGGWISKNWLHVVLTAFVGGSFGEIILYALKDSRDFNPVIWLAGIAACFVWAAASFLIRKVLKRSK